MGYRCHHTRCEQCGSESVEVTCTPCVRDVRDPKPSRERIILVEVLWYVQVGNQIFTLGGGEGEGVGGCGLIQRIHLLVFKNHVRNIMP
jgi:hypothetical protein